MSLSKRTAIGVVLIVIVSLAVCAVDSFVPTARLVPTAEARVGRPLTPVSVAGVARRTSRRH